MAHKTLVGGTAYEITGGRTLVNGTGYSIDNGKTLVGGTAYEVGFWDSIVTLTSEQGGMFGSPQASVMIKGNWYSTENGEIKVKEGSVITCSVTGENAGSGMGDHGTGRIYLNGVEIVTAYNGTKTYDYVVTGDVSIHLNTMTSFSGGDSGEITITGNPEYRAITYTKQGALTWGYSITVDGEELTRGTQNLLLGTVVNISVRSNGGADAAKIILNGNTVAEQKNGTAEYSYIVTRDAAIHLNMTSGAIDYTGTVTITET